MVRVIKRPKRKKVVNVKPKPKFIDDVEPKLVKLPKSVLVWGEPKTNQTVLILDPIIGRQGQDEPPQAKSPITGPQLKLLAGFLKENDIRKRDFCIISCCPPVTQSQWKRQKAMSDHLKEHREDFMQALEILKPRLIVPMGAKAATQLSGKNVAITKARGLPVHSEQIKGAIVLPTLGVNHVLRIPDNAPVFSSDIYTIGQIIHSDYSLDYQDTIETNYEWRTDIRDLLKNPPKQIALDCEWSGCGNANGEWYERDTKLLTVQITPEAGRSYCLPIDYCHTLRLKPGQSYADPRIVDKRIRKRLRKQLKQLLENPEVRVFGQNFKSDWMMLNAKLGIEVANYHDDTILLAQMTDENAMSKALTDLVRRYVPAMSGYSDDFDRDPIHIGKTRMDLVPPDKMLEYGCGDTDATFRLKAILEKTIKKDKALNNCYRRVVMPAINTFCYTEQEGFCVSKKALHSFEKKLRKHQYDERQRLLKMVPREIRDLHISKEKPSITRPVFLIDFLFKHPKGLKLKPRVWTKSTADYKNVEDRTPSVSAKDHLPYFKGHPFVDGIIDFIKNDKMLTTYVGSLEDNTGFYKYIFDGRVRPSYLLHRTKTGRSASVNPNGQNFPKRGMFAKDYRRIFEAPPGWTIVDIDYSQVELRIAALMAREPTMLDLYRKGADIHAATAAAVMGLSIEEFNKLDPETRGFKRFQAKAVNFGFLYGMGWRKFIVYAKTDYGIEFTEEEAQEIRKTFFATYRALKPWHDAIKKYARRYAFVRAFNGRVRHLPSIRSPEEYIAAEAERQAVNSPVQGMGSDLGLMAMAIIREQVSSDLVKPLGFVHDSLIALVPDDRVVEGIKVIKQVMENLPLEEWFDWKPDIPLLAEAEVGKNLADLIEVEARWIADKKVKSYYDIQICDWKDKVKKAKEKGTPKAEWPKRPAPVRKRLRKDTKPVIKPRPVRRKAA